MKKLLTPLLVGVAFFVTPISIVTPAHALQPPTWNEFCLSPYCTAEAEKVPGYNRILHAELTILTMGLYAPFQLHARNKYLNAVNSNYWYDRRMDFQAESQLCQETESDKAMCYLQVRQMESQKNAEHQAHLDSLALQRRINMTNANVNRMRYQMMQRSY